MFCSNCGNKIEDDARFCPDCGAAVNKSVVDDRGKTLGFRNALRNGQGDGIFVDRNFDMLAQSVEKGHGAGKIIKAVWIAFIAVWAWIGVKGLYRDIQYIAEGKNSGFVILMNISVWILGACMVVYLFWDLALPFVAGIKEGNADSYLGLIHVTDKSVLLNTLKEMNCPVVKDVYVDGGGNVCVQGKKGKHTFLVENDKVSMVPIENQFKYKLKMEKEVISVSLIKFLAPDAPIDARSIYEKDSKMQKINMILLIVTIISGVIFLYLNIINPELVEANQKYIKIVKNASPQAYPNITYGKAFDTFFGNPEWQYFKSTDNHDVVEFHGSCLYGEEETEIAIQFLVSYEEQSGEVYAITLDGDEQPEILQTLLLLKVFEDYGNEEDRNLMDIMENMQEGEKGEITDNNKNLSDREGGIQQETYEPVSSIKFPILFQAYTDDAPCPVMVNDESADELLCGTYDEMLASCIDDGVTMYAPPEYYNGAIYVATRWDALPEQWFDGLLTYDEFIEKVNELMQDNTETSQTDRTVKDSYNEMHMDVVEIPYGEISGGYSGISTDGCSISMYSSIEDDTVGNIELYYGDGILGELINLQTNVYQIATETSDEIVFGVFTDNGVINLDLYINGVHVDYLVMYEHYYS